MAVASNSAPVEAGVVELQKLRVSMSARKRMWFSLIKNKPAMLALLVIILLVGTASVVQVSEWAQWPNRWGITPYDPINQELANRLKPPFTTVTGADGQTNTYILGTDKLGRDILSRIMKGAGVSLFLGFVASAGSLVLGVMIGLISGYFGGKLDDFIMRFADIWLAFPALVLFIAVIAVFGTGFWLLVIILAVGGWVTYAKVARGQVLSTKQKEYVEAAKLLGAGNFRIMLRHILPNVVSPLIIIWTFSVATIIIVESGLSFLGLGIQPPAPAWGSMLSDGRELLATAWWLATFPGLAIMLTVLAVNIFGDALRDILDPRLR
jgi:peptide/nickel transport system permease protein